VTTIFSHRSKKGKNFQPPDIGIFEKWQTFDETPLLKEQFTSDYCIASIVYREGDIVTTEVAMSRGEKNQEVETKDVQNF
ncbi:1641_t:CDS:1, partial [Acaulospora morrowiae]